LVRSEAAVETAAQDVRRAREAAQRIERELAAAHEQLSAALATQRQVQQERDAARADRDGARRALRRAESAVAR
jgi:hypothetical protein